MEIDNEWAARAAELLPTGASTGSKRPEALYGTTDPAGPTHFVRAAGCRVETADGAELIDCTMALGAVAIGYAEPAITQAAVDAIAQGAVSGLSHVLEVELAERFCNVVPCAERVQFVKTGAEAMSAAVRIARAYTGRNVVIGSGYFGWHDWSSSAAGVPDGVRRDFRAVPFDDVAALERAAGDAGSQLAAIAIEPVVERMPSEAWIARARALCDATGAALIFDEMKTGFRLATGGFQQMSGVTPDLSAFGKALANGFPLAAVCGRAPLMESLKKTWISSTLASEGGALAAALAVLDWHEQADVCAELARIGVEMRERFSNALKASGLDGISVHGIDPMWFAKFDSPDAERRFISLAAEHGALFKRGAYNFAALAHDEDALVEMEAAASNAFVAMRQEQEPA
ncbi:MAG TPA: aminotransferase class III-fold pyridoxal phosphate-dependent enzyme [Gemmatimonadaceae bacterium]|nr:aminotransferase class III-fold pyridoxal phosphate-dependent enzyme [Gemmatimonadaceae bacterium]